MTIPIFTHVYVGDKLIIECSIEHENYKKLIECMQKLGAEDGYL